MAGSNYSWDSQFTAIFDKCVAQYHGGSRDYTRYYSAADSAFLSAIGCQSREFFDFVEDFCEYGEPTPGTALLVAAARRDFFLTIQHGKKSTKVLQPGELPSKDDTSFGGIRWLARILAKARAKLRGELHPDTMYGCGGDRQFLEQHGVHAADFLRAVWATHDDDGKVLDWLKAQPSP